MTFTENKERIESFREFRGNWDSYGARTISETSIAVALRLINDLDPEDIMAGPDGGIQFEWDTDDRFVELRITPDGAFSILSGTQSGNYDPVVRVGPSDLAGALAAVKPHLVETPQ